MPPVDQAALDNWFRYHSPQETADPALTASKYERIRAAGKVLAEAILGCTPASADQTAAIRKVREAVMTANASVACGGK